MHISIACPHCQTHFQVDPALRGRMMRCPNATCRQVFEVREDGPPASAVPDWRSAPPPRRDDGPETAPPPPAPREPSPRAASSRRARSSEVVVPVIEALPVEEEAAPLAEAAVEKPKVVSFGPTEMPPGAWEPPPVRGAAPPPRAHDTDAHHVPAAAATATVKKRRALWIITGILTVLFGVLGTAGGVVWYVLRDTEEKLVKKAEDDYAGGRYHEAAATYRTILDKFPDSGNADDYRFLRELAETRAAESGADVKAGLDLVLDFLESHKDDPRTKQYGKDVAQTAVKLMREAAKGVLDNPADPTAKATDARGVEVGKQIDRVDAALVPPEVRAELEKVRAEVDERLAEQQHREKFLGRLTDLKKLASAEGVKQMHEALRVEAARGKGFERDARVVEAAGAVYAAHLNGVAFTADQVPLGDVPAEDYEPSLIVQPLVRGQAAPLPGDRIVFALARGVLYALRQSDGSVVWALRVGVDTANLPIRLPPLGARPEMALIQSADTKTLIALNARTGDPLWRYRLDSPPLGRPVVIDRRAYVPTYDGQVHEIELAEGNLLGRYKLGQRLSLGGARAEGTRLIYFPADDTCVYVLDVANRRCQGILYTDHAAGSLRGEPIVIVPEAPPLGAPANPDAPGFLVLSQTNGLDAMLLRTFRLSPAGPRALPEAMGASGEPRMRGWSWFPPYRDAEKVLMTTDAGEVGLFGIVQPRNQDAPLFPLVRLGDTHLPGVVELSGDVPARGRAQVVYALENDLWVLARGALQRHVKVIDREHGPRLVPHPSWSEPLRVGSPLHESQRDEAGTTLFVVTQPTNQHNCLATAVDAETGKLHWQRQLGLVCQGDPLALGGEVLTLDQGGALFGFDPARHASDNEGRWQSAGRGLAAPLADTATTSLFLVPAPDGRSAYEIACPDPGAEIVIRHHVAGRQQIQAEVKVKGDARLAGTPAVGAGAILLPLADGRMKRVPLPLEGGATLAESDLLPAPDWREGHHTAEARGHCAWLGGNDFVTTNGRGGLTHWRFGKLRETIPAGRTAGAPTRDLASRVVAAPLVLTRAGGADPIRLIVADAAGTIHLLEGDLFAPARKWDLPGKLTSGPFLRGGQVGCVVDRRRLVWIDPLRDGLAWPPYETPGEGIVGQPQLVDGLLVVADLSGRFVGLDPRTGKPRGPGYVLKANVAPAASPAAFGEGRAFAPLTDGTVLLLSTEHLRQPLRGVPAAW